MRVVSLARSLLRLFAGSAVMGIAVAALFSAHAGADAREFFVDWAIAILYGLAIGVPAMLSFRAMRPRLNRQTPLRQWFAYLAVLAGTAILGTAAVRLALTAVGVFPADEQWDGFVASLQISFAIGVPCAVGATLYAKLNHRLATTEGEKARALALATEARLASLESRIRPHFLFNALNSAIALIPEDPAAAERVLERLCALLRFSLDAHERLVPLAEELRVTIDYLEIERVRFGARLAYTVDVPESVRGLVVPAFAVQTLVENSVKYAVSPRREGATIAIRARADGGRLRLEILDDGPGFAGEVWLPGHGLDGLRARLDALYGARAALVAPAAAGAGAAVAIELPVEAAA